MARPDAKTRDSSPANVARLIDATGKTIEELATLLGLSKRSLQLYKAGGGSPMPYPVQYALESLARGGRRSNGCSNP